MDTKRIRAGRTNSNGPRRGAEPGQARESSGIAGDSRRPTATEAAKPAPFGALSAEPASGDPREQAASPWHPPAPDTTGRFPYEVELDLPGPIPVFADNAIIDCKFRHFHDSAIELKPGQSRALNVGFRVYDPGTKSLLFEDRMRPETARAEPGSWIGGYMLIPRKAIPPSGPAELHVDMVKEDEFWFAATPEEARQFSIDFVEASESPSRSTEAPRAGNGYFGSDVLLELSAAEPESYAAEPIIIAANSEARYHLVFDVSDLMQYFREARLPTGIQRVQMQIIDVVTLGLPAEFSLRIASFSQKTDHWTELPTSLFQSICKLALASGDKDDPNWRRAVAELETRTERSLPLAFPRGAFLINLGTSWWLRNYFLNVRLAKARYGIRYVPYVHDCIPIITPEHCVANLTRDFISWVIGAFQHADHIVANSQATATDVCRVARELGHAIPEPAIVRLDARYGHATPDELPMQNNRVLRRNDLRPGEYVLFVSTIESRKNHLLAFAAWLGLIKKHGIARVPKLVCVGNRGWLNDAIYAKLTASSVLQQKVVMLSGIPDADLERLYRNCLFTLFPSSYEGWGLPVTESLCCGKVPLVSNCSSLPEAGGEFAVYFDVGSETELVQQLERLIFDAEYRQAREAKIAAEFRPRSWADIAASVLDLVRDWAAHEMPRRPLPDAQEDNEIWPFEARPGRYYGLTENGETRIWPGMVSGEMFRQGNAWWWPEPWGAWTKPPAAGLAFFAPFAAGTSVVLFIGIRGVQSAHCTATVRVSGVGAQKVALGPAQDHWMVFPIPAERLDRVRTHQGQPLLEILFSADKVVDFRHVTHGVDHRVASIGVRGFMVCAEDDVRARLKFIESVALGNVASLEERPMEADYILD